MQHWQSNNTNRVHGRLTEHKMNEGRMKDNQRALYRGKSRKEIEKRWK